MKIEHNVKAIRINYPWYKKERFNSEKNRKLKRINKDNLNLKNHLLITVKNNPVQKEGL